MTTKQTVNTEERLRLIRRSQEVRRQAITRTFPIYEEIAGDIDFLLFLLDSQTGGHRDAEVVARLISDNVNQYPITSESVYEWQCMIADALTSARESAATRMREACVDAIKTLRATPHGAAYNNAVNDAIHKIESLTLDQVVEKQEQANDN